MLVDSHCHLDLLQDYDGAVQRAKQAGVAYLQTIGTSLPALPKLLDIANQYDNVFASAGVHPCSVKKEQDIPSVDELVSWGKEQKVTAFGETGLDYYHPEYNKIAQQGSLLHHIYAGCELGLPLIIHNRNSDLDCQQILATEYKKQEFSGLIHCFASDLAFAKKALDIGFYISISGIITFSNAQKLIEVVAYTPLERLLVETDSPYLAPVPMRGKTNEPAFVKFVAQKIADIKGISKDLVEEHTTNNFFKLFAKAKGQAHV